MPLQSVGLQRLSPYLEWPKLAVLAAAYLPYLLPNQPHCGCAHKLWVLVSGGYLLLSLGGRILCLRTPPPGCRRN